ncbi:PASTA domain-containing protein [Streptococcus uberis]|uniref:PASTA domain-containing protein n=1 Tax=Streptococcus uberis TaxID=1349 RepID=UPI000DFA3888|nr:PASTA domain-containing protein [Streptococcus uberis]MCK1227417.1 PASTA domain-containing protein [Streptococcus uberis]SUO91231.1 PnkB-like serine/threonine kinase protein [Streptococcus uberis]
MVKISKFSKSLGVFGKIISIIPDTTEIIGKGLDNGRPIVEKYMDQKQAREEKLKSLDNVINLPVEEARQHLEKQGFVVATIPVRPDKKWLKASLDEVVIMSPRSGKLPVGSLVKLYYVTTEVLEKSQSLLDQDNLKKVERNQKIADTLETVKHIKMPFGKK